MKIIFTPLLAGKPWNGRTLVEEPLGGSESAVGFLARAMAKRGHECIVYTHHPEEGVFEDVTYRNHIQLSYLGQNEFCDIHISSRWVEILGAIPPEQVKQRILWLHDLGVGGTLTCDKAVFLSKYHEERMLQGLDIKGAYVVGNGVNLADYEGYVPLADREPGKMLWTSNPDRGLHVAARILQNLRKRWPELSLHVFGRAAVYGWDQGQEAPYYPAAEDMENVFFHEPVSKTELAQELKQAWALFYPTTWPETYCIATLEAQAAGTPVISVPFGALPETVKGGILDYDFEEAVKDLRHIEVWDRFSKDGIKHASTRDWNDRAREWEDMLAEEV